MPSNEGLNENSRILATCLATAAQDLKEFRFNSNPANDLSLKILYLDAKLHTPNAVSTLLVNQSLPLPIVPFFEIVQHGQEYLQQLTLLFNTKEMYLYPNIAKFAIIFSSIVFYLYDDLRVKLEGKFIGDKEIFSIYQTALKQTNGIKSAIGLHRYAIQNVNNAEILNEVVEGLTFGTKIQYPSDQSTQRLKLNEDLN